MANQPLRDKLQKGIYKIIDPIVKLLIKFGLTPNAVTVTGLLLNIGVAVIFIVGAEEGNRGDLRYIGWAGGLVLFAGLFSSLTPPYKIFAEATSRHFNCLSNGILLKKKPLKCWSIVNAA